MIDDVLMSDPQLQVKELELRIEEEEQKRVCADKEVGPVT